MTMNVLPRLLTWTLEQYRSSCGHEWDIKQRESPKHELYHDDGNFIIARVTHHKEECRRCGERRTSSTIDDEWKNDIRILPQWRVGQSVRVDNDELEHIRENLSELCRDAELEWRVEIP